MKKTLLGVVIIGSAFVLSGCGKQAAQNQGTVQNQAQEQKGASSVGSAITSIKDAMGLGTKMKCEYSMGTGADAVKSIAYVEGKKHKSVGTFNGITTNTIFDGENMYNWQEGQKTGFKMTMTCINDLKASLPADKQDYLANDVKSPEDQFDNATSTSCSPTSESINFSAPSDVTFKDQCEMLKGMLDMTKNMKVPAGVPNIPNMPSVPAQ